ncbi:MAG TPA: universal stress protein [Microlunatus sp.]
MTTHETTTAAEHITVGAEYTRTGPILVGVDDSPEARAAAIYAAGLADSVGRTLLLAHAHSKPYGSMDLAGQGMTAQLEAAARELVDGLAADVRQLCSVPIETVIAAGKPAPVLGELAGSASMLVVGQDTATLFDRMTFGSVAAHLVATAPCPLVVVPASWDRSPLSHHPVVVLSGDPVIPETLTVAIAEAKHVATSVLVVGTVRHAAPSAEVQQHQRDLSALVLAAQEANPEVTFETRIVRGHPGEELVQLSADAAAVVVGGSHRHGQTAWIGSVAQAVAKRTHCPLIIVPAE